MSIGAVAWLLEVSPVAKREDSPKAAYSGKETLLGPKLPVAPALTDASFCPLRLMATVSPALKPATIDGERPARRDIELGGPQLGSGRCFLDNKLQLVRSRTCLAPA